MPLNKVPHQLQKSNSRVVAAGFGASDASLTLLQCQQLAEQLKQVARQAVSLHQQVSFLSEASSSCLRLMLKLQHMIFVLLQLSFSLDASGSQRQMAAVLQVAFQAVNCELQGALQPGPGRSAPGGQLEDDRLMVLLEKYSEQLVQMTQNKLSRE